MFLFQVTFWCLNLILSSNTRVGMHRNFFIAACSEECLGSLSFLYSGIIKTWLSGAANALTESTHGIWRTAGRNKFLSGAAWKCLVIPWLTLGLMIFFFPDRKAWPTLSQSMWAQRKCSGHQVEPIQWLWNSFVFRRCHSKFTTFYSG